MVKRVRQAHVYIEKQYKISALESNNAFCVNGPFGCVSTEVFCEYPFCIIRSWKPLADYLLTVGWYLSRPSSSVIGQIAQKWHWWALRFSTCNDWKKADCLALTVKSPLSTSLKKHSCIDNNRKEMFSSRKNYLVDRHVCIRLNYTSAPIDRRNDFVHL